MQRLTRRLTRSQSRQYTAYGVAVLTFGAALVATTALGQQAAQAQAIAKATVSIDPASLGFTAADFPRHACQLDFGGGPYADQDVWVFKLPGEHDETGEFINIEAEFTTPEGDTTVVTIPGEGGGTLVRADTDKAWAALPQGLTLVNATAEITGTADSFILGRTCPAGEAEPSPSASPAPSSSATPPVAAAPLPSGSASPSVSPSAGAVRPGRPGPSPSGSASPSVSPSAGAVRPGRPGPSPSGSVSPSASPSTGAVRPGRPGPSPSASASAAPIVLPPVAPVPSATAVPVPSGSAVPVPSATAAPAPPHHHASAVRAGGDQARWASGFPELWAQIAKIFN
ncbi:hypothetical protein QEZ54_16460 [Catellatospora sp. KI3]|uniref:hypothetical protein n=1 Tax=Catellatospora sp. KI3 TaxID=3041620 RepID=UPI002482A00D|nr:hypothetical protein [Catellatospora sp. KI3]MDI1462566.1 hypothetical protein [Catellatospora sp. KI3]